MCNLTRNGGYSFPDLQRIVVALSMYIYIQSLLRCIRPYRVEDREFGFNHNGRHEWEAGYCFGKYGDAYYHRPEGLITYRVVYIVEVVVVVVVQCARNCGFFFIGTYNKSRPRFFLTLL